MSYLNGYFNLIWNSIIENINEFYYFLWNISPEEPIQMKPVINIKPINEYIEKLEFILSKEIKKDLNQEELINLVKTEIQYINKKMSMSRNISQVNVDDIVAKTELFNILQDIACGEVYVEQIINDFNS
jgi:hypothetical protein